MNQSMNKNINIGVIGLGKMGLGIAERLIKSGFIVAGFDPNESSCQAAGALGVTIAKNLQDLSGLAQIFWLMLPAGETIDCVLEKLTPFIKPETIIIDGGNSFFQDSIKRYKNLAAKNISYLDCGTSGGLAGREIGYSLMIGGDKKAFECSENIFKAIAAPSGYGYMGPSGAGHYVKMVHNGIEYSLLQAYAEGFQLLKEGSYKNLDLAEITRVWQHGSIIRSYIVDLSHAVFTRDQDLEKISGQIGENKTGRWAIEEAQAQYISMDLLEHSVAIREWSRESGGNYATKVVAMLRHEFGGHEVKLEAKPETKKE